MTHSDSIRDLTALIANWADEHMPDRKPITALTKMIMEEIPELITSDYDEMEVADVGILLFDLCHLLGINLGEVMLKKMAINTHRTWVVNKETGLLKHVKE